MKYIKKYWAIFLIATLVAFMMCSILLLLSSNARLNVFADWLSGIGTIGAVCVSLFLSYDRNKVNVENYGYNVEDLDGNKIGTVHIINPDDKNYYVKVLSCALIVGGKRYDFIDDAIISNQGRVWPKRYVVKSGQDLELFGVDWFIIRSMIHNNKIPGINKITNEDYILIRYEVGRKIISETYIYYP